MIKLVLFGLLTSIALIGVCTGGIYLATMLQTAEYADSANRFLTMVTAGDFQEAYISTSGELRAAQDKETFIDVMRDIGIESYSLQSWSTRTLPKASNANISGTVLSADGRMIPVLIVLVSESGEWNVSSLTGSGRKGVGSGAWFRGEPTNDELKHSTQADILRMYESGELLELNSKLFFAFVTFSSSIFLERIHRPFIQPDIDLAETLSVAPMFDQDTDLFRWRWGDLLVVSGHYPVEPQPIPFRYLYRYVHPEWKLFSVQIRESFEDLEF